jgi:hypothetical protein
MQGRARAVPADITGMQRAEDLVNDLADATRMMMLPLTDDAPSDMSDESVQEVLPGAGP